MFGIFTISKLIFLTNILQRDVCRSDCCGDTDGDQRPLLHHAVQPVASAGDGASGCSVPDVIGHASLSALYLVICVWHLPLVLFFLLLS